MENKIILFVFLVVIALIYINSPTRESYGGSYGRTCMNCKFKNNILSCQCKTMRGNYINTSVNVNCKRSNNIENINGVLKC